MGELSATPEPVLDSSLLKELQVRGQKGPGSAGPTTAFGRCRCTVSVFFPHTFRILSYLLHVKNTGKKVLVVEPGILSLCNSKTFKDCKKARQGRNSCLILSKVSSCFVSMEHLRYEVARFLLLPLARMSRPSENRSLEAKTVCGAENTREEAIFRIAPIGSFMAYLHEAPCQIVHPPHFFSLI